MSSSEIAQRAPLLAEAEAKAAAEATARASAAEQALKDAKSAWDAHAKETQEKGKAGSMPHLLL